MPVADGARSGAAAGGTGWQPWAGCPGPKGRGRLLATARGPRCGPSPSPASSGPAPGAASAHSARGRATAGGARPGRGGECTALGLQGRGAQSGPQGIALTAPPAPLFVSPRKPQGKGVAGVGGKAATPGLDAGAGDRKRDAWTPLASPSPSPSPGHTASFATSVLFPGTPRRGGSLWLCVPIRASPVSARF